MTNGKKGKHLRKNWTRKIHKYITRWSNNFLRILWWRKGKFLGWIFGGFSINLASSTRPMKHRRVHRKWPARDLQSLRGSGRSRTSWSPGRNGRMEWSTSNSATNSMRTAKRRGTWPRAGNIRKCKLFVCIVGVGIWLLIESMHVIWNSLWFCSQLSPAPSAQCPPRVQP